MSDKHHNPQPHQSPVHDDREAKPGLDALAPKIRTGGPRRIPPPQVKSRPPRAV